MMLDDPALPADACANVADVLRMIGHARRAIAKGPTFLAEDNERMRDLLAQLIRELPESSAARERIRAYLTLRLAASPG
jgi:hypothetical protein